MQTGAELIAAERREQIEKHGITVESDVFQNPSGELMRGTVALLEQAVDEFPPHWDKKLCDRMLHKSYVERLIIAGAFLAAEIDRVHHRVNYDLVIDTEKSASQPFKTSRPPLGLVPLKMHNEQRYDDIKAAMHRCVDAGKVIPQEWYTELQSLEAFLKNS